MVTKWRRSDFRYVKKELTLYPAQGENRPLIVFNTVMGDGEELAQALRAMDAPDCNLLVVGKLQWYHDMTPWSCPPLSKRGPAATEERMPIWRHWRRKSCRQPGKKIREVRRTSASPGTRWLGFCALCDVPLRLLRVGGQHVRLPVVSEVPGIRASA